jgi:hypothetical protein
MKRIQDKLMKVYPDTKDLFAPLRSAVRRPGCALVISSLTPFTLVSQHPGTVYTQSRFRRSSNLMQCYSVGGRWIKRSRR